MPQDQRTVAVLILTAIVFGLMWGARWLWRALMGEDPDKPEAGATVWVEGSDDPAHHDGWGDHGDGGNRGGDGGGGH